MSIFEMMKPGNINKGVEEFRGNRNSILVDVRSKEEYSRGHIPGSVNIPLDRLGEIEDYAPDKSVKLYVHCLSGARSGRAVSQLKNMGYENAENIGGIGSYKGELAV